MTEETKTIRESGLDSSTTEFQLYNQCPRGINWEITSDKAYELDDAASIQTWCDLGNHFYVTLGGNRTLATPLNARNGGRYVWEFLQDGTGSRTITLSSDFCVGASGPPVLTTTANRRDFMGAIYRVDPAGVANTFYVVAFQPDFP